MSPYNLLIFIGSGESSPVINSDPTSDSSDIGGNSNPSDDSQMQPPNTSVDDSSQQDISDPPTNSNDKEPTAGSCKNLPNNQSGSSDSQEKSSQTPSTQQNPDSKVYE